MTRQSGLQSWQERKPLFAQGRQIAPNAAKGLCSRQTAETARDLLLHFDHAQIALGQIVVKIYAQIFQEAEGRFLVFAQPIEQIACRTLFDAPLAARRGCRSWRDVIPFIKQTQKGEFPIEHFQRIEPALSLFSCVLSGLLHGEQQVFELGSPDRSLLLCLKHQLAQHMDQTERMLTVIQEVRCPAIVDTDALEERQDANRVQSLLSSARIHMIMGQARRTRDVLPVSLSSNPHARFVLMQHGGLDQGLFDLVLDASQLAGRALDQLAHRGLTHLHPQQVREHFTRAFQRQQLLLGQIDGHRCDARSILDGSRHGWWERGQRQVLTVRTLLLFGAVFLHDQLGRGHVHHLPPQRDARLDLAQIVLTGRADPDPMLNHFIWLLGEPQGRSRVSLLPAAFLLALLAQAFWLPHKAIGGGGQATIVAIFGQSILQVFDVLGQRRNLFLHLLDQQALLLDAFLTLGQLLTQALIFFFHAHACTLRDFMTFGKSRANLGSYESCLMVGSKLLSVTVIFFFAYIVFALFYSTRIVKFWERLERRRQMAAGGDQTLLALEQPRPDANALPLPTVLGQSSPVTSDFSQPTTFVTTFVQRPNWTIFLVIFGVVFLVIIIFAVVFF